ncbi:Hypothetical protein CINCED_3A015676 [Cinara cedri]|uniref:Uncharacterized protein n=1 Tax=Cinara cedri TaxID=506608 RepID=A0A5E4M173_9HEMI|nr:Hypothetical protein CINCED_3A015676 [Cinara cedri]
MASNKYILNSDDELCKYHAALYTTSHGIWQTEEKCRIKKKSIEDIEYAIKQAELKNEFIEKQLQFTNTKIEGIMDNIVCMDKMIIFLYDTIAHLDVQYDKRVFSINKSKKDYELQLFLKTELWRKEEDRLNNIPEIKSLNMANSELESTKLEFEELLEHHEMLKEKIDNVEVENDQKRNNIVVQFVTAYIENLSLDENIKNDITLLRKLEAEYQEKLSQKNALLEFRKDKINKISHWIQIPYLLDSNMLDLKIDSLDKDLISSFNHDNISFQHKLVIKPPIPSNKPQVNESEVLDINDNTHLSNTDSLSPIKTNPQFDVNVNQCIRSISKKSKNSCFDNNKKLVNKDNLDLKIKKRKSNEVQSDFEFKKPPNLLPEQIQDTVKIDINKDKINSKNIQPCKKTKNMHEEINFTEYQKPVTSFHDTLTRSAEQSNVINATSEKTNIFDFAAVPYNEILSVNINRSFSDLGCDDDSDMDCSKTSSLFDPEFIEMYKSTYNGQHQYTQSNIANSGNGIFQQLHNELDTNNHTSNKASTSKEFSNLNEPYQSHFMSSDLFK